MDPYDAIVLGTGGVGSAAAWQLARRGARVLGLDRFAPGHDRGSSHGESRLIRQAYFEHPNYVPLLRRAFELWGQLQVESGEKLYHQVGLLQIGPPDGEVLEGVRASAAAYKLAIENLSRRQCEQRFAGLGVPEDCEAVFETRAGYLRVERCVLAHVKAAQALGAELRSGETIGSWRVEDDGVVVQTDRGQYRGRRLVIAAGAWAGRLLADLNLPLHVLRKPLFWFRTTGNGLSAAHGCPAFFYELSEGCYYGVPQIDAAGVKLAEHTGGQEVIDPLAVNRELDANECRRVAEFAAANLRGASGECTRHTVCLYTMSPDGHFIVDRHPDYPQVVFAAGLSGHGFKFTGVLGEALADLALEGASKLPIGFLSASRASLARL